MWKPSFLDLCKKVKKAWPEDRESGSQEKPLEQVSLLRNLSKYVTAREMKESKTMAVGKGEMTGETASVHRCSLDAKHYHLMIHGEALARRLMKKKRVFATNPREQVIASSHLKRLDLIHATLKRRSIIQVQLEEPSLDYLNAAPKASVERHFLITRVTNYH